MKKVLIPLIFGAQCMVAQQSFTLEEAKQYAIANHTDAKNAKLDIESNEKRTWEIIAQGLPQVSASGQFQNFIDIPTTVVPANAFDPTAPADQTVGLQFGTNFNVTGNIEVAQLIFNGNYIVGVQAIKALGSINAKMAEKTERDIRYNVAEAYNGILVLQENRRILDGTLANIQEIYASTQKLVEQEVILPMNGYQLELSVLQVQNAISSVESQLELANTFLKFQMGYDLNQDITLTDDWNTALASSDEINTLIDPKQNIDYKLVENQLELDNLNLKNTKANYLPSLSAFFSHQQNALRNDFNFFDFDQPWYPTTLWGLQLNVPIFSSGMRRAQVSQAALKADKTINTLEQVDQGLQLQIKQGQINLTLAQQKVALENKSIEVAQKVLDDTEKLYNQQTITSIDLTQAQSQLLTAQTNYTNALFELIKAKLALDKLAGNL